MKEEIKNLWVQALRSGNYKQGRNTLKTSIGNFCCLGVLCDISGLDNWDGSFYIRISSFLPAEVMDWAGMKTNSGMIANNISLAELNDKKGMTFNQIADFIEEHWKEL